MCVCVGARVCACALPVRHVRVRVCCVSACVRVFGWSGVRAFWCSGVRVFGCSIIIVHVLVYWCFCFCGFHVFARSRVCELMCSNDCVPECLFFCTSVFCALVFSRVRLFACLCVWLFACSRVRMLAECWRSAGVLGVHLGVFACSSACECDG
jgi:hypothetical protein